MSAIASDTAMDPPWRPDAFLCAATMTLLGLGLVILYSSSGVYAVRVYGDAEHFLMLQLQWLAAGLVALLVAACIPRAWLARRPGWLFVIAVGLCIVVLIPGIGHRVGGARRWLRLAGWGFQPSELAKFALVVLLAALLARRERGTKAGGAAAHGARRIRGPVLVAQIPVALVLAEPDLGTALVMELLLLTLVFAAGLRLRTLLLLGLATLPVFYHFVVGTPFRLKRLLSYLDPWAYRSTSGYQITEALIAIGSGGITGVGLGESKQKLFFLPEAHTDFIFAILAEELGFVGVVVLLMAFAAVLVRGTRLATHARDAFDRYLALGLTALIGIPALFNVAVVTGLLPTKGLPLPLVSAGGSNLVLTMAALGTLLRIDRDLYLDRRMHRDPDLHYDQDLHRDANRSKLEAEGGS